MGYGGDTVGIRHSSLGSGSLSFVSFENSYLFLTINHDFFISVMNVYPKNPFLQGKVAGTCTCLQDAILCGI